MGLTGKNILVTGGAGFIGSHLVERLAEFSSNIIVTYRSISPRSYFFLNRLNHKVTLVHCDKKDFKRILDVITKYEIDYIFHLAAQPIVTTAFYNPRETFETNVMGTVNILEAARLYGQVKGIVVTSSDKAYGKIKRASEKTPISGDHPYETSKASADLVSSTYFKTYSLPITITRFGNVYGEGDINFSRIVPGLMKSLVLKKRLELRSDGTFVRDYVYVKDVVDGLILLISNIKSVQGEVFNLSSWQNFSVVDLIKVIERALKMKVNYKVKNTSINEISHQSINFSKIKRTLGWQPKRTLEKTSQDIFEWYKNFLTA